MFLEIGKYISLVSREPAANVTVRLEILQKCKSDPAFRAGIYEICRRDPLFWIAIFVWQVNPNAIGLWSDEEGPFIPWNFQDLVVKTIIEHIVEKVDLFIEKSREMGASWLCLLIMVWFCLFHRRKIFLCISHTEFAVDKPGDPNCLFWKVDHVLAHLPNWMKGTVERRKLGFVFTRTDSTITGSATSERSGVSGRATGIFLDEFSKQQNDFEIFGQTADTGTRIFNGTHYGTSSKFYELSIDKDVHKLVLHWSMHPDKRKGLYRSGVSVNGYELIDNVEFTVREKVRGEWIETHFPFNYDFVRTGEPAGGPFLGLRSPWYDKECRRRKNARDVAMHLDIDPTGALSQVFDPLRVIELIRRCKEPMWEGHLDYSDIGKPAKLIPQKGGEIKLWMMLDSGKPPKGKYVFAADCATGRATASPSCLSGINLATGEKVFEYSCRTIEPTPFGTFAVAVCRLFRDHEDRPANLIWEIPGPGLKFGDRVLSLGFRQVYCYKSNELNLAPKGQSTTPGWPSSRAGLKRLTIERYRDALYDRQFLNYSEFALRECLAFEYVQDTVEYSGSRKAADPAAAGVNHGDLVIADALCWWMRVDLMGNDWYDKEQSENYVDVIPFGSLAWRRKDWEMKRKEEEAWA